MLAIMRRNQRGDTIVEVMIVLAVLGSAIGISYSTASRSLLNARQAHETSEGSKIAQTQIEMLYAQSEVVDDHDNTHYIYDNSRLFCMGANDGLVKTGFSGGSLNQASLTDANYPTDDSCTSQNRYRVSIRYEDIVTGPPTIYDKFTVRVAWDDVLGDGLDTVTLVYKIHKPVASTP